MKKKLLPILFLCIGWTVISAQNSKVWDFPVGPEGTQWKNAKTLDERLSLYNIPVSILNNINTEDLVTTCLNYPELRMIMTRNSSQQGYEFLKGQFNGFRELEKRVDAGKYLLNIYVKKNHNDVTLSKNLLDQGKIIFSFFYLEILLSQDSIINNMTITERITLRDQAIKSFEDIERLGDIYGTVPLEMPSLIIAKILNIEKETDPLIKNKIDDEIFSFITNSGTPNVSVWYRVYNIATGN